MRRFPYAVGAIVLLIIVGAILVVRELKNTGGQVSTPSTVAPVEAVAETQLTVLPTLPAMTPIAAQTPRAEVPNTPEPIATEMSFQPQPTLAEVASIPTETPRVVAPNSAAPSSTETSFQPQPTLADAVVIPTETPRVVIPNTPAVGGAAPVPQQAQPLPTIVPSEVAPVVLADTSLIELPGEPTELPIVPVASLIEEDLGSYPNVQLPMGVVAPNELYVAQGDIYGTGQCFVHIFQPGELVSGLSSQAWQLVRISGGAPQQRQDLARQIQEAAADDPVWGGSCPFG